MLTKVFFSKFFSEGFTTCRCNDSKVPVSKVNFVTGQQMSIISEITDECNGNVDSLEQTSGILKKQTSFDNMSNLLTNSIIDATMEFEPSQIMLGEMMGEEHGNYLTQPPMPEDHLDLMVKTIVTNENTDCDSSEDLDSSEK